MTGICLTVFILIALAGVVVLRILQNKAQKDKAKGERYYGKEKETEINTAITKFRRAFIICSIVLGALFVIFVANRVFVIVPAGHVGVVDLFGSVRKQELSNGLKIKNPFAGVEKISIKEHAYTMSDVEGEGEKAEMADAIKVLSNEGLEVKVDVTVQWRVTPEKASFIYRERVYDKHFAENYVRPQIRTAIREIAAKYTAFELYSDKREAIAEEIREKADKLLRQNGVRCTIVNLRNIDLPPKVKEAIERKKEAEQDAERMDYVLVEEEKKKEQKRIKAEGDALAKIARARGDAEAIRIVNDELTRTSTNYLRWYYINKLGPDVKLIVPERGSFMFDARF